MGMVFRQEMRLEQRLEQRLVMAADVFEPPEWLTGSPEDFLTLLEHHPPIDDEDQLHYLIAGGWGVEILTRERREHHDLDIIRMSRRPLAWRVDEQKPTNYFGAVSLTREQMRDYMVITPFSLAAYGGEGVMQIPTPSIEFLFLSKIAGFLREPRPKDYDDLGALAAHITPKSVSSFKDLLFHVPGMHKKFWRNTQLYRDLGATVTEQENARELGARYLLEIAQNLASGAREWGIKQASRFHQTLNQAYTKGLKDAQRMSELSIDDELGEEAWSRGDIKGFWAMDGEREELFLPDSVKNRKHLKELVLHSHLQTELAEPVKRLDHLVGSLYVGQLEWGTAVITSQGKMLGRFRETRQLPSGDVLLTGNQSLIVTPRGRTKYAVDGELHAIDVFFARLLQQDTTEALRFADAIEMDDSTRRARGEIVYNDQLKAGAFDAAKRTADALGYTMNNKKMIQRSVAQWALGSANISAAHRFCDAHDLDIAHEAQCVLPGFVASYRSMSAKIVEQALAVAGLVAKPHETVTALYKRIMTDAQVCDDWAQWPRRELSMTERISLASKINATGYVDDSVRKEVNQAHIDRELATPINWWNPAVVTAELLAMTEAFPEDFTETHIDRLMHPPKEIARHLVSYVRIARNLGDYAQDLRLRVYSIARSYGDSDAAKQLSVGPDSDRAAFLAEPTLFRNPELIDEMGIACDSQTRKAAISLVESLWMGKGQKPAIEKLAFFRDRFDIPDSALRRIAYRRLYEIFERSPTYLAGRQSWMVEHWPVDVSDWSQRALRVYERLGKSKMVERLEKLRSTDNI